MKPQNFVYFLLANLMLMNGAICWADDNKAADIQAGIINSENTKFMLANAVDTGCCVFLTPQPVCATTNKDYCETRAKKDKLSHEFHVGKNCKQIPQCK